MNKDELNARTVSLVEQVSTVSDYWTKDMEPVDKLAALTGVHAFLAGEIAGIAFEMGGRAADAALVTKAARANQAFLDVLTEGATSNDDSSAT